MLQKVTNYKLVTKSDKLVKKCHKRWQTSKKSHKLVKKVTKKWQISEQKVLKSDKLVKVSQKLVKKSVKKLLTQRCKFKLQNVTN